MNFDGLEQFRVTGARGVTLHAAGVGRGRLVLFLHGFPECWCAWHRQLREFGRGFRAVALDLRGYNLSDKPSDRTRYGVQLIADDVRQVIAALSPDQPVVLVGHDWGGIVAWTLARESSALIDRMVIINAPHPAVYWRELKRNPAQFFASGYAAFFQLRGVAEGVLRAFDFAALRAMIYRTSARPDVFTPELRRAYLEAWRQPHALTAALNYYRNPGALKQEVAVWSHTRVEVPTLVLWGERDVALRPSNLAGLAQFATNLQVRRHPTATHWVVHEEPEWVNGAIHDFLRQR